MSGLLAWVIGLFSLRVRAIFFAMITLAVASAFQTLVSQWAEWTGGEDGYSAFTLRDPATGEHTAHCFSRELCGGTHVARTGQVGMIVVLGVERFKGGSRVAFVCGERQIKP